MFAAIHAPQVGLQLCLPHDAGRPAALLDAPESADADRRGLVPVREVNAAAATAGVAPGLTASQALARCPQLRLFPRDTGAEDAARQAMVAAMERETADCEDTAPGLVLGDFSRQRRDFPRLRAQFAEATGLRVRLGRAATPDAAHLASLLATEAEPELALPAAPAALASTLAPLPVETLRALPAAAPSAEMLQILRLWGVHTLGALAALPRAEVVQRLGSVAGPAWDIAAGRSSRLLRLVRPVPEYAADDDLEAPLETLEPVLFCLRRQLSTLCARLQAAWLCADAVRLSIRFENGTAHARELRPAEPTTDVDLLLRLLHTHLDTLTASAPVTGVAVALDPARPTAAQRDIFRPGLNDPARFSETLGEISALLGPGRAGTPVLLPTRRADGFVVGPAATQPPLPTEKPATPPLDPPWRRLRPPLEAEVTLHAGVPVRVEAARFAGEVAAASGPHHASGEWWDADQRWQLREWEALVDGNVLLLAHLPDGTWQITAVR